MRNFFLIIILFSNLSLFAQKKYVYYGAKEKYYLSSDEKNMQLDDNIIEDYNPFDPDTIHQVPLQRFIKTNTYKLFIGLAMFDTPQTLVDYYMSDKNYSILIIDEVKLHKTVFFKIFAKFNGLYNYKLIFRTKKSKFTVVFNYVSNDREILEDIWNQQDFFKQKLGKRQSKKFATQQIDF